MYANGSTTETTTYVGKVLEKVTVGSLTDWRHYTHAGSRRVAVMSRSSTGSNVTRYILEDHQNSIAHITDNAGANFVSESFTAFGARRDAASWNGGCNCDDLVKMKSVTRKGYTGHDAIGGVSMGLNHMNGRVQDAITGRFLSPDPFVTRPGNTQNYNRYSYVDNNPLSFTDPSGFTKSNRTIPYNHDYDIRSAFDAFRERRPTGGRGFSGGGRESPNSAPAPDLGQPDGDDEDEDEEDDGAEGDVRCTADPSRTAAIEQNPGDPNNLAPGKYPTKAMTLSASGPLISLLSLGAGGENRYLADFATSTVHEFTTFSLVVGFDYGASMQFAGGAGNRNYTTLHASGSAVTGFGTTGALDLVLIAGAGISTNLYPGSSTYNATTTTIGFGADVGASLLPSWTLYRRAIPVQQLDESLQQFYLEAWNHECGM